MLRGGALVIVVFGAFKKILTGQHFFLVVVRRMFAKKRFLCFFPFLLNRLE